MNGALLSVSLDRNISEPLKGQLLRQLRRLILTRAIEPGDKLPSSRKLSEELSVSRVTVTTVFNQLISEGYLSGRQRSGVYVEAELPDYSPAPETHRPTANLRAVAAPTEIRPFELLAPELELFPYRQWSRFHDQVWRNPESDLLAKQDRFGWLPLRSAISDHLREWRGVACDPAQIAVTSGVVESLSLIAETIFSEGDTVLMEDPGYSILRRALKRSGMICQASKVDKNGLDVARAIDVAPNAKAAIVTPSRQFPLGMTLSLSRRLELIEWAEAKHAYVIEDDFDSEFRYQGQPLPAMMSLNNRSRVIYLGSFSKVMLPSLRLGFVVFPDALIDKVRDASKDLDSPASLILQPVLARFMEAGDFAIHIRRMRRLYAKRQRALIAAIEAHAHEVLSVDLIPAGMHLVARLRPKLSKKLTDREVADIATRSGISVKALSSFYTGKTQAQGLVLGFAGFDEDALQEAVVKLASALSNAI